MATSNLKQKLPQIRESMNAALAEVAKKHGLKSLIAGNCTFDPNFGMFTFKVEGIDGDGKSKEEATYELARDLFDLPPLGTEFKTGTGVGRICGMKNRSDFVLYTQDGKRYKVDAKALRARLVQQGIVKADVERVPS